MILINLANKKEYFVPLKKNSGEEISTCPECSETRKKKSVKCFSFNHDKQVGRCGHCNITLVVKREFEVKKEYKKPVWHNKTELSSKLVKWFEQRRAITQKTLIKFRISEGPEWMPQTEKEVNCIHFNYFRNDELVTIQYRDGHKRFKLFKNAELIFYNLDAIKSSKRAVITEGQIDCMTLDQCGITDAVSVPNGAGNGKLNLDYLDNCIEYFLDKEEIVIATDDDLPGRNLCEQLAERLGKERCKRMLFRGRKDANEVLVHDGPQAVIDCFNERKEFPLEGVFTIENYSDEVDDIYENGLPEGAKTQMNNLNDLIKWHLGYIYTVTGYPGEGKTELVDQVCLDLTITADWPGAFYSPENKPTSLHISKLARKLMGKGWWGNNKITKDELLLAKTYLNSRVFFIKPEHDFTLKTILSHVKYLILRKGIKWFVIDAWNKLEHKYTVNEHKYIGESLDDIATFCELNNVLCILVAHPTKPLRDKNGKREIPNLYSIAGSSNFFNKTDGGMTISRDYDNDEITVYVQKVKFTHWGQTGYCKFKFDKVSGRFNPYYGGVVTFDNTPWIHSVKGEVSPEVKEQAKKDGWVQDESGEWHPF